MLERNTVDTKEKAFRISYDRYIGKNKEVDEVLDILGSVDCSEFFVMCEGLCEDLKSQLTGFTLEREGLREMLLIPLDGSISEKERVSKVIRLPWEERVNSDLVGYPFYFSELLAQYQINVFNYIYYRKEGYRTLIQTMEKCPGITFILYSSPRSAKTRLRQAWAEDIFHLVGPAKDMFLEGTTVSIETLREICV